MIKVPDPQRVFEIVLSNEKEIEQRFLAWARDFHKKTGSFATKEQAEEVLPKILVEYVYENLDQETTDRNTEKVVKKILHRVLQASGLSKLHVEVIKTGGEIRAEVTFGDNQK